MSTTFTSQVEQLRTEMLEALEYRLRLLPSDQTQIIDTGIRWAPVVEAEEDIERLSIGSPIGLACEYNPQVETVRWGLVLLSNGEPGYDLLPEDLTAEQLAQLVDFLIGLDLSSATPARSGGF